MWSDEAVKALKTMWTDGLSASQAAKELNQKRLMSGCTRNAVIGKVHRLGLTLRAQSRPTKKITKAQVKAARLPKPKPAPVVRIEPPPPLSPLRREDGTYTTVLTLDPQSCKFPIGDPAEKNFAFCGRERCRGPYCSDHAQVAYEPAQAKKPRAYGSRAELRRMMWQAEL